MLVLASSRPAALPVYPIERAVWSLDLHQPVIACAHHARIAAALALDHSTHEILGQIIGRRVLPDQCVEIAVGIDNCEPLFLRKRGCCGQRNEGGHQCKFASHNGSSASANCEWKTRPFVRNSGNFVTQPETN